jgi:hypothetical protein
VRKYRHKFEFTQVRNDTEPIGTSEDGKYILRKKAPKYPVSRTISVSRSVLWLCKSIRVGRYANWDEFFIELAERIVESTEMQHILRLNDNDVQAIQENLKGAHYDRKVKRISRLRAARKRRYFPRKLR